MTILLIVAVLVVLVTLSRGNGKLHILRLSRHRTILLVFVTVILVYFMCYTTMWMQFSGAVRRPREEDTAASTAARGVGVGGEGVGEGLQAPTHS